MSLSLGQLNFIVHNLADIRKYLQISPERFGMKIGVSRSSILSWESKRTYPTVEFLRKIEAALEPEIGPLLQKPEQFPNRWTIDQGLEGIQQLVKDFHAAAWGQHDAMCESLGVTKQTIYRWEQGTPPTVDSLMRVENYYRFIEQARTYPDWTLGQAYEVFRHLPQLNSDLLHMNPIELAQKLNHPVNLPTADEATIADALMIKPLFDAVGYRPQYATQQDPWTLGEASRQQCQIHLLLQQAGVQPAAVGLYNGTLERLLSGTQSATLRFMWWLSGHATR